MVLEGLLVIGSGKNSIENHIKHISTLKEDKIYLDCEFREGGFRLLRYVPTYIVDNKLNRAMDLKKNYYHYWFRLKLNTNILH